MVDGDHTASLYSLIGIAIGSITAFFIALIGLKAKKKDNELNSLESLKAEIKELKILLRKERKLRGEVEGKFESIKLAFSVIFDEYEIQMKEHPESLGMLKSLRKAFD